MLIMRPRTDGRHSERSEESAFGPGIGLIALGLLVATWLEYEKDQTLFWLVRMMDLGFVIPASFAVAVGLLRRTTWAVTLVYAFLGFQTLMVAAVAGMAIMMAVRSDPASSSTLLGVSAIISLVLASILGMLLRKQWTLQLNVTRTMSSVRTP